MPRGYKEGSIVKREVRRTVRGRERTEVRLYVRVRYTDSQGIPREKKRRISQPSDAPEAKRSIYAEIKKELDAPRLNQPSVTFDELATYYEREHAVPAVYMGGVKVKGLRSHLSVRSTLTALREHFGEMNLSEITYDHVRAYREKLLQRPVEFRRRNKESGEVVVTRRPRSITTVHRYLQIMRRVLNVGRIRGWMPHDAFRGEEPLIRAAEEEARMRILSRDEERRLLEACGARDVAYTWQRKGVVRDVSTRDEGEDRSHLRPAIICALDTAMRAGEQFGLTRGDVSLEAGIITAVSYKGRRRKVRHIPVTDRLRAELVKLLAVAGPEPEALVFPVKSVNSSFESACVAAGLEGFRWHDLRHTAITWMLAALGDPGTVMKISGHDSVKTFLRYVTINEDMARALGAKMDAYRAEMESKVSPSERVPVITSERVN